MFNSPILEVTIGLVFIFLLYSLLVTTITEAIATLFGLRARMLRTAIVERMLANISNDDRWKSIKKGAQEFFGESAMLLTGRTPKKEEDKKLGDKFFDHPQIKNYGASGLFPRPSYIPGKNFSTVLMDILNQEFDKKKDEILSRKKHQPTANEVVLSQPSPDPDLFKINEVIGYYGQYYSEENKLNLTPPVTSVIDKDTWEVLQMHLSNSAYDVKKFAKELEDWFDDTMDRVSGWYKRQTQALLFFIGITIAVIFNVDTIQISGKLSKDEEAREALVALAIEASAKYQDDPRVQKIATSQGEWVNDTTQDARINNDSIFKVYQLKIDQAKKLLEEDIKEADNLIALGWGNADEENKGKKISGFGAVCKKILGFLITAFAISLGAPFWFDLLNKLVKLRGTGKKEESDNASNGNNGKQPITLNINPQKSEEAVG